MSAFQGFDDLVNYFTHNATDVPSEIGNTLYGLQGNNAANAFTAEQNALNRAFQSEENKKAFLRSLEADSTAVQRRVKDLEAAGLNPLLAFSGLSAGSVNATSSAGSSGAGSSGAGSTIISAAIRAFSQIISAAIRAM